MTVLGPIPVEDLGLTLTHEHILSDVGCNGPEPEEASRKHLFHHPLTIEILGEVQALPQSNRDNQRLTDVDLLTSEVAQFAHYGGRSIVEVTLEGFGRDVVGSPADQPPDRCPHRRQSRATTSSSRTRPGCARCPSTTSPTRSCGTSWRACPGPASARDPSARSASTWTSPQQEEKNLRGACRASARTQVPLTIHTPGGTVKSHDYRRRILDIVEEEGADIRHTIMEHVYIRPSDFDSQLEIASRGAFLGYDGVSCEFNWGFRGSGPCDHELAVDVKRLIDAGFLNQVLISHDVHLKIMLTAFGGTGYSHILRYFVPRLREYGVTDEQIHTILVENPRRYFSSRYRSQ